MKTKMVIKAIIAIFICSTVACKNEKTPTPKENLVGKIVPSLSMLRDGMIEFYDLRDVANPKKAAFNVKGNSNNFYFQFVKSRPIGTKTVKNDYGDLSINHNNEIYLADRNWPNWKSISMVRDWIVMNNDNTNQMYAAYQDEEGVTKYYDYEDFFEDYKTKSNWGKPGTINACVEIFERYNSPSNYSRNAFYFNLKNQEYLFQKDLNNTSTNPALFGYKITDLIKKPNGNMDTDPIDWTKADIVLPLDYNNYMDPFELNGKQVTVIVFIDLDTKTYAAFARNVEDDAVNGADKGRQTLLTTSWQPLTNIIKGWDL